MGNSFLSQPKLKRTVKHVCSRYMERVYNRGAFPGILSRVVDALKSKKVYVSI
jgi:hypothetical protein